MYGCARRCQQVLVKTLSMGGRAVERGVKQLSCSKAAMCNFYLMRNLTVSRAILVLPCFVRTSCQDRQTGQTQTTKRRIALS